MAHAILAILLASAIAATLVGRRAHKPGLPPEDDVKRF
jgi:hypothetical protein